MSNQRPNSSIEFKNTHSSLKETVRFDQQVFATHVKLRPVKLLKLTGMNGSTSWLSYVTGLEVKRFFDCLVPGSGGKDSFYQSWVLKYKYGMNPLTVTWAPNIYTDWGRKNFDCWIHSGMDNYLMTASGRSKRLLTRLAIENLFHAFQPFIIGQKAFAPKMAILFNIPLVFYGENEAEYNPIEDNESAQRSYDYFSSADDEDLYIGGKHIQLKGKFGLTQADLSPYLPSDISPLKTLGAEVHYLVIT